MDITVIPNGGKEIDLRLPTGLVANGLSATVVSGQLKKNGLDISGKQLRVLFRAMKRYRAQHPEWMFIEVESHDGTVVRIEV